jgi:xanthine/CO dehydrogenase XdhC/CoxF family maturation factor
LSRSLQNLLPLFEREHAQSHPMVLATVIRTAGPSYTKGGAQMLIAQSGEYAGLLSGGCLEGDLSERAGRVLRTRNCELARYDMRGPDDLLFGLGSGCEGAMDILLQRLDAVWDWQPMKRLVAAWKSRRRESLLLVVPPLDAETPQESTGVMPSAEPHGEPPPLQAEGASLPLGAGVFIDDGSAFGVHGAALEALRAVASRLPDRGVDCCPRAHQVTPAPACFCSSRGFRRGSCCSEPEPMPSRWPSSLHF